MSSSTSKINSASLDRIQEIEERVISCVDLASSVTEELSRIGSVDKTKITQMCSQFLENINKAQKLMQEAISKPSADRDFESSSYQAQARAQIAAEKVRTVEGYLAEMQKVLATSSRIAVEGDSGSGS